MPDSTPATAPAQPDSTTPQTTPQTAAQQAGASGDFGAYEKARFAESTGKPLAPAPTQPAADADPDDDTPAPLTTTPAQTPAPAPAKISARQQKINDYERTIAAQNERIARLEAGHAPPAAPRREPETTTPAPAPAAPKFPDYATFLTTTPDATLEQWMDARDDWRDAQRETQSRHAADVHARTQAQHERTHTFSAQIDAQTQTQPDFLTKLSPDVLALRPITSLGPDEKAGPLNIVADLLIDSPRAPALMQHLSDHPEELRRITAIPPRLQRLSGAALASAHAREMTREMALLEARLTPADAPAPSTPTPPKTITSAPDPPFSLGKKATTDADPEKAAVATGDYTAYERARFAQHRNAHR